MGKRRAVVECLENGCVSRVIAHIPRPLTLFVDELAKEPPVVLRGICDNY